MSRNATTRRTFLYATTAAASTVALAGCSDGGDGGGGGGPEAPQAVDDYLGDTANRYDGTIEDATGQSEVTIDVGAGSNGFAFDPAAVRVDAGTTVVWEWTGTGSHNVVSVDDSATSFDSGSATDEEGYTFEQTFESAGIQLYECIPHSSAGMIGAVEVVE